MNYIQMHKLEMSMLHLAKLDYSQDWFIPIWFIVNYIIWHCKQLAQATLTLNIRCSKCSVSYHDDIQMELIASEINSKQAQ